MIKKFSLYGSTGFIGSNFSKMYDCKNIPRDQIAPSTKDVIYMISTTHNYHVLEDSRIDIETNLLTLVKILDACRDSEF
jgi:dTDP-D-glucose 4,6-dehydratase